eukprot:TRINITY_DN24969_c0_g1_i1.p1 TRINITY_DN24969_c0_g1~~TRINITY_DN24969_c0_g1_i1.p1  ORF type:complete len:356 (-),score=92.61 TRINITY_DN24969_c0_g1_i1:306-1373(-)
MTLSMSPRSEATGSRGLTRSHGRASLGQVGSRRSLVRRCQDNPEATGTGSAQAEAHAPREFVTKRPTVWHAAPCADSARIGMLQTGRRCTEVVSDRRFDGWLPISPRGFVRVDDVVALSDRPLVIEGKLTPGSRRLSTGDLRIHAGHSKRLSTSSSVSTVSLDTQLSDAESLALKAEQVRLREANVGLREESVDVANSLQRARQEKEKLDKEIEELRRARHEEQASLARCKLAKGQMKQKLALCKEVVESTVKNVDLIYDGSRDEVEDAFVAAEAGALEASRLLETLDEEEDGEEEGAETPAIAPAMGKENDIPTDATPASKLKMCASTEKRPDEQQQQQPVFGGTTHNINVVVA